MGYLLPALTDAKFSNQREVVLNERRQNYENRPYGLAGMAIVSALYPADHPVPLADDRRRRRHPRRAHRRRARVLPALLPSGERVAGAGGRHRCRDGLRCSPNEYFGEIPGGEKPGAGRGRRRPRAPAEDVKLVLEDRVELPRLYMAWHSPALFADGDAELDLVARSAVERQDVAPVSRARLRAADRDRGRRLAELARARQLLPDRRHRGARAARSPKSSAPSSKETRGLHRSRPDRRRSSSAAWRRPRRTSSSGCRPSAGSAASRIS